MKANKHFHRPILFETIRTDALAAALAALLRKAKTAPEKVDGKSARKAFVKAQRLLVNNIGRGEISGTYLQDYLCRLIAADENTFALMSEAGVFKDLVLGVTEDILCPLLTPEARTILLMAANEIGIISELYRFDFSGLGIEADELDLAMTPVSSKASLSHRELIHEAMTQNDSLDAAIMLSGYYYSYGSGLFQASTAFSAEENGLVPVKNIDPVTFDDLVGCESQKRALTDNIDILLSGFHANNMLLYGDSGTGKSSSVKALLNMYAPRGLKLISLAKNKLALLPGILEQIADRGMKYIIFIDDLSFEENEHEYKAFKSIIEGRVTPRPKNAVFIVTTNRKNIVKEVWSDREGQSDVRRRDNMQEKKSLADRFGITLIFPSPDKNEYLKIVRKLAEKSALPMPDDELASEALKWELHHGGRSGRAARQFVDYMAGIKR